MVIYKGSATLVDGDRREVVSVTLQTRDGPQLSPLGSATTDTTDDTTPRWEGRILSNFDRAHWCDDLVTIELPTGASSHVVVERSGTVRGFGQPPFGC